MKISRNLFLALTGAIGGTTACYVDANTTPPPAPPPRVVYQYQYQHPGPPGAPATATAYYYINSQGQRVPVRVVYRRPAPPVGGATQDPTYRPAPATFRPVPGPATEGGAVGAPPSPLTQPPAPPVPPGPAAPAPPAAQSCLDATPMAVPDCSGLKIEPTCGIRSFVIQKCNAYRDDFDPSVATVAVDCLEHMSGKQLCDAENVYNCGKQALSEACADSELTQLCSIAATSCRTSASDCTALLSGLNDGAKQQVARCIATGCHAGLYSCVEGLTDEGKH